MGWGAAVPRLGVVGSPHIEGYHGVAQGGPSNWGRRNPTPTTQFPQAYGLGSTWDPELLRRVAAQEAYEARYLYQSPVYDRSGIIAIVSCSSSFLFHILPPSRITTGMVLLLVGTRSSLENLENAYYYQMIEEQYIIDGQIEVSSPLKDQSEQNKNHPSCKC